MFPIYDDIEREWGALYYKAGMQADKREELASFLLGLETSSRNQTQSKLQPCLGILEFGIEYLSYSHVALSEIFFDTTIETGPRFKAAYLLIGSAISFGLSIRLLSISGFDTPARALLRTFTETLFLCLAVLDDEKLAQAYAKANDTESILDFWHKQARPQKLHQRIIDLERKIGFDTSMIDDLTSWRREHYDVLSQASHLSYMAAAATVLSPDIKDPNFHKLGIFGRATSLSHTTLAYTSTSIWYFSRISHDYLIGKDNNLESLLTLDTSNEWQRKMVFSRDVLSSLILTHAPDQEPTTGMNE